MLNDYIRRSDVLKLFDEWAAGLNMMNDLISRQALYEILDEYDEGKIYWGEAEDRIGNLPSAQPEPSQVARDIATIIENEKDMRVIASAQPEIIRCKDCLWRIGRDCTRFTDLPVYMDDYCGRAKRKGEQDEVN